jgi:hypothetical protein
MKRHARLQTAQFRLESIEEDVVSLGGDQFRAVLEVGSVNFALQGETEQEATVAGFAAFLNGLNFPMQVLVRVLPLDLERYLADLERGARPLSDNLVELARDHAIFLRRLARSRTLLERRFYLIVPSQDDAAASHRFGLRRRVANGDPDAAPKQLTFRCEEIARQLARCGLTVRRLTSAELAQLFYACWCPELSRVQRLRRTLADEQTLVVESEALSSRRF